MSIRIQLVQFLALCREGNVDAVRLFAVRCRAVVVSSMGQGEEGIDSLAATSPVGVVRQQRIFVPGHRIMGWGS